MGSVTDAKKPMGWCNGVRGLHGDMDDGVDACVWFLLIRSRYFNFLFRIRTVNSSLFYLQIKTRGFLALIFAIIIFSRFGIFYCLRKNSEVGNLHS
jgi:hypothetical protein